MFKNFKKGAAWTAALLLLFGAAATPAAAFEVSPMRVQMSPSGSGASEVVTVRNTLAEPLAIEVFATDRVVAEDGTQSFPANETDFLLFPPQAFIQPGESQAFRVQYIGDPALKSTKSYVINVSQVPVHQVEGAGVQVVYQFGVAVYVHPKGATAALAVRDASAEKNVVAVRIDNQGDRIAFLTNDRVVITTPSGSETLEGAALKAQLDNPIVPPRSTRVFTFKAPGVKPGDPVGAVIYPRDD